MKTGTDFLFVLHLKKSLNVDHFIITLLQGGVGGGEEPVLRWHCVTGNLLWKGGGGKDRG